ncbi:MAG: competence/damage-inducible protein A [Bacteroidota bacterium]|nr:competence/damage-inducible protein A [Bacteroidota bacterium]
MKTEIITIGDEILIGQIVNSNAAWLGEKMNSIGIEVAQMRTIPDKRKDILEALEASSGKADIILITGGLGPTKDDITKQTLAEYFHTELKVNEKALEDIEKLFRARGLDMSELNRKQAEIPKNCLPLRNTEGTAPGMWFEENGCIYVSMPGVPYEMKSMIMDEVIPRLRSRMGTDAIYQKTVLTQGIGESWLSEKIENWEDALPANIKLAYLPQPGIVRLRITASGDNKNELEKEVEQEIGKLKEIIPGLIFGYDDDTLEQVVGEILKEKGKSLATAESCTGGYIAHLITSIAGSSEYYTGSVVSYANRIKIEELGVSPGAIEKQGAVSETVVRQMAEGIKQKFKTNYAIATSGIAGPSGGSEEKPVGTTWIAIATPEKVFARKFQFGEHRGRNIRKTAVQALNMLRKELI